MPNVAASQKITPFLWFDKEAEEAAKFYVSIFKNSAIEKVSRYGETGQEVTGGTPGKVMTVTFMLEGQRFTALNGGPLFKFTEAISFMVGCDSQEEVDTFWSKLTDGGQESQCGWLKDRYGLSWQIVPRVLFELIGDKDRTKAARATQAMLKMKKLDIAALKRAHAGG
jgi:predicted 3-demethylubiquinone-9 3-methyltransferase (glyoxalase superfamily)